MVGGYNSEDRSYIKEVEQESDEEDNKKEDDISDKDVLRVIVEDADFSKRFIGGGMTPGTGF